MSLAAERGCRVIHDDCMRGMAALPAECIDAVVTDPPYEIGFMGKKWDATGVSYNADLWREVLRVLKPGGHLLAFGGTRTYHRMAVAIEDAGFEVRDSIHWIYGSGFPKSLNVGKAIDDKAGETREVVKEIYRGERAGISGGIMGNAVPRLDRITAPATPEAAKWSGWGTALKPAHEPIVVARKPLDGTVAENILAHGTGALNIDGCRVAHQNEENRAAATPQGRVIRNNFAPGAGRFGIETERPDTAGGRWPANIVLTHAADCRRIGTKRVKSPAAHPIFSTTQPEGWGTVTRKQGEIVNYGDADGYETVEAWDCAFIWQGAVQDHPRTGSHSVGNGSMQWSAAERVLLSSELRDSLDGCPACLHFCDALAHAAAAASQASSLPQGGVPAPVLGPEETPAHTPGNPRGAQPSWDEPSRGLSSSGSRASKSAPPPSATDGTILGSVRSAEAHGRSLPAMPYSSAANRTSSPDAGSHRTIHHSGCIEAQRAILVLAGYPVGPWASMTVEWKKCSSCPVQLLDDQSGILKSGDVKDGILRRSSDKTRTCYGSFAVQEVESPPIYADEGGASRFFPSFEWSPDDVEWLPFYYAAKASRSEREAGLDDLPARAGHHAVERKVGSAGLANPRAGAGRTAAEVRNHHPTVKPLGLMEWLVRLATPNGGTVLDPFAGTCTTGCAAARQGFKFIGFEQNADYHRIAQARLDYHAQPFDAKGQPRPERRLADFIPEA